MSEENEKNDPFNDLSESEKYHVEQMMIDRAYENSYKLITKKTTFEDLMDARSVYESKDKSIEFRSILIYDPSEGWDDLHLEDMIDYFEETEEYEKCAELKKILDKYV
tara:strand:+ start:192 stop:515 length:324 start_codon:yes stop_codon:yes gene_type:complete